MGQSGLSFALCKASLSDVARTSFFFRIAPPGFVTLLILYSFTKAPTADMAPAAKENIRSKTHCNRLIGAAA